MTKFNPQKTYNDESGHLNKKTKTRFNLTHLCWVLTIRIVCCNSTFALLVGCSQSLTPQILIFSESVTGVKAGDTKTITFESSGKLPVLVSVAPFEATVDSIISDQAGLELNHAYFDFRRGVPLFQLLEPRDSAMQYQLEIDISRATSNSILEIKVFALPGNTALDAKRFEAYKLYSDAVQKETSYDPLVWTERMNKYQDASHLFEQLALTKEQLWSEFLGAVLAYFPMSDVEKSLPVSRALFKSAQRAGLNDLAVMALQLEGQSLMYRGITDDGENSPDSIQKSIEVFNQAAIFARDKNQTFQQAWALNNVGIAHYYRDEYEQAIGSHNEGLIAGRSLNDTYLNNVVNSNIAAAMQGLGEFDKVTRILIEIADSQRASDHSMELAFTLDHLGNTYSKLYRFDEAIKVYSEAFEIVKNHRDFEMAGLLSVSLGNAYFEMGYLDNALQYIDEAIGLLEPINAGFGLKTAHATAARIYRILGDDVKTETHRKAELNYAQSELDRAKQKFEQAVDMLSNHDRSDDNALKAFGESYELSRKLQLDSLLLLSQIHLCLLKGNQSPDAEQCGLDRLRQNVAAFSSNALPREKLEVQRVWADFLILRKMPDEARLVLLGLLDEIQFYRSRLSGVMGAWYWQSRADVFQKLMNLQIASDRQAGNNLDSFLLLNRLRNIGLDEAGIDGNQPGGSDVKIRSLMAQMKDAKTTAKRTELEQKLQFELLKIPADHHPKYANSDLQSFSVFLSSIPSDAAILTYYFSDLGVFAWVADSKTIRLIPIPTNGSLASEVTDVFGSFRIVGDNTLVDRLGKLGEKLLKPVVPFLKESTYFMAGGPLNGFPLDALRYQDRYLAESHTLINLQSLDNLENIFIDRFRNGLPETVFLSGNPFPGSSNFPALGGSDSEIRFIETIFTGSEITLVSGKQFTLDVINGNAFQSARLIHIASHGVLNLKYPELSEIMLSPDLTSQGNFLTPRDISRARTNAELVVLSACETGGVNTFQFDNNLGFVSEFLAKGTPNVISSLFPVSDKLTNQFMQDFYTELVHSKSISGALAIAKRRHINSTSPSDWAAFQLSRR